MSRLKFFSTHSKNWDENITKDDYKKLNNLLPVLNFCNGEIILDIGCGTGVLLPFLKKLSGENSIIYALDNCSSMLQKARFKHDNENFKYILADVHHIPLSDNFADKITCYSAFPHFSDKPKALSEIHRVLKTNGKFVILHTMSRDGINNLHKNIGKEVAEDNLPSPDEMTELFTDAGFVNILIQDEKEYYTVTAEKK